MAALVSFLSGLFPKGPGDVAAAREEAPVNRKWDAEIERLLHGAGSHGEVFGGLAGEEPLRPVKQPLLRQRPAVLPADHLHRVPRLGADVLRLQVLLPEIFVKARQVSRPHRRNV